MIQIQGGQYRSRRLVTPKGSDTRPTSSKLRAALCDASQGLIVGAKVLDLFAGSGAMGLELLSRGASACTFVENNRKAMECLQQNVSSLGLESRTQVIFGDVFKVIAGLQHKFDYVYVDPPYKAGFEVRLFSLEVVNSWALILEPEAMVAVEWSPKVKRGGQVDFTCGGSFVVMRDKAYGDTQLTQLVWVGAQKNREEAPHDQTIT